MLLNVYVLIFVVKTPSPCIIRVYYFGWLETPNIIWTDISKINEIGAFEEGQPNLRLKPQDSKLVGDVVCEFKTEDGKAPAGCAQEAGKEKKKDKSPKTDKTRFFVEPSTLQISKSVDGV